MNIGEKKDQLMDETMVLDCLWCRFQDDLSPELTVFAAADKLFYSIIFRCHCLSYYTVLDLVLFVRLST